MEFEKSFKSMESEKSLKSMKSIVDVPEMQQNGSKTTDEILQMEFRLAR